MFCLARPYGMAYARSNKHKPWNLIAMIHWAGSEYGLRLEIERRMAAMPKKPEPLANGSASSTPALTAGARLGKTPALKSYLCDLTYEGTDERRMPSYLIIRPQGGSWHVTLKDPSTGLQIRASCGSYDLIEATLEGLLTAPGTPWEVDPWADVNKKPRRRKGA